jgi:hypothetical protein
MKDLFRVVALILLVGTLFVPAKHFSFLKSDTILTVLGTLGIIILVLMDTVTGTLLVLALLAMMYRIHVNELNVFGWISSKQDKDYVITKSKFTTSEHLKRAQTNVVDEGSFGKEIIGIEGVYGEPVYGAQGIDPKMPGYDVNTAHNANPTSSNYPL